MIFIKEMIGKAMKVGDIAKEKSLCGKGSAEESIKGIVSIPGTGCTIVHIRFPLLAPKPCEEKSRQTHL